MKRPRIRAYRWIAWHWGPGHLVGGRLLHIYRLRVWNCPLHGSHWFWEPK